MHPDSDPSDDLDPSDLDPSDLDPSDLDPSDLNPSDLDLSRFNPSPFNPSSPDRRHGSSAPPDSENSPQLPPLFLASPGVPPAPQLPPLEGTTPASEAQSSYQLLFPRETFLASSQLPSASDPVPSSAPRPRHDSFDLDDKLQKSDKKPTTPPLYVAVSMSCIIALVLAILLRVFVAQAYEIRGRSMEPTLHDGEKVMIFKLAPTVDSLERGDLVIFQSPRDANKDLIKRVVALGGDDFDIRQGDVFVNGERVDEAYANHELYPRRRYSIPSPVPEGTVVVLGDNRPNSQDSRSFGAVPIDLIKGKVVLRWWPLSEFTTSFVPE